MDINGPFRGQGWVLKYLTEAELPEVLVCRFTPGSWVASVMTDPTINQTSFWSYLMAETGNSPVWDFCVIENNLPLFLPSGTFINQYGGSSSIMLSENYRLWGIYPHGVISDVVGTPSNGPFHYHYFDVYYRRMPEEETAFIPHQGGSSGGAGASWRWPSPIVINGETFIKWTPFPAQWDSILASSGWVASDWFNHLPNEAYIYMHPLFIGMLDRQVADLFLYFWPDWDEYKFTYTAMYVKSNQLFQENINTYIRYDEKLNSYRMQGFNVSQQRQAYINARNLMLSPIPPEKQDADMGLFDRFFWWAQKGSDRLIGFLDDVYHPTTWDMYFTGKWFSSTSPQTATVITRPPVNGLYPPYMSLLWGIRQLYEDD